MVTELDALVEGIDGDLADDIRRLPRRALVEAAPPEGIEPSAEAVDSAAAGVRVEDASTFCRHSYMLAVLCLRIEEELEESDRSSESSK